MVVLEPLSASSDYEKGMAKQSDQALYWWLLNKVILIFPENDNGIFLTEKR